MDLACYNVGMDYDYNGEGSNNFAPNNDLLMQVEDVFLITRRGTVLTGKILSGPVKVHDKIQIISADGSMINAKIQGIEAFRRTLDMANSGDNVGLLIGDIDRSLIERGASVRRRD